MRKQKILIPLDGSDFSKQILPHIRELFPPQSYELLVMRVLSYVAMGQDDDYPSLAKLTTSIYTPMLARSSISSFQKREHSLSSEDLQDAVAAQLKRELVPLQKAGYDLSVVSCFGDPVDEIIQVVENKGVDLVAMATHGRTGLSRLVLGSVAEKILRRVPVPVLLVRPSSFVSTAYPGEFVQQLKSNQPLRLVLATDGSPQTEGAAIFTGNLARTFAPHVSLQLFVIVPDYQSVKYGEQVIAKTKELVGEVEPSPECVPLVGYAEEVIQERLSLRGTDLLIISHFSDQPATKSSAIDTTVQRLAQHAPTSVIIAKGMRPAFKRILACTAIGDDAVVEAAAQFAQKVGATLRLLHVLPSPDSMADLDQEDNYIELDKALRDSKAGAYLERSLSTLQELGFEKETMVIRHGSPPNNILQEARRARFDMIMVGSQSGPGHFLGSIANHVVRHAEQSVFVVRMR